jgi:hypothetical protein
MIDIPNFCDYFITETFVGNYDWLGAYTNNIKFWKPHDGPGKWRYVLWDTDLALLSDTLNKLSQVINPATPNPHSTMLSAMLANDSFRVYFINRYADLVNTTFHSTNMISNMLGLYTEMEPEMDRHFDRWGSGYTPYSPACVQWYMDTAAWKLNLYNLALIMYARPYYVRNQVQNEFSLAGQVDVTLQTFPAEAGTIHLNTITPDSLPWTGVYFDGNPITMTAMPRPGYKFVYWEANHSITQRYYNPTLRVNVDSADTFTAHFEQLEPNLLIYPNPFYDDVRIYYEVPEKGVVTLRVYDLAGRLVSEILPASNYQPAGAYSLNVNAAELGLAGGMYLFELRTPAYSKTVKMISGRPKP